MFISLIIPTYNEAKNLPLLLEEIFGVIDRSRIDLEVIVVDDGSPDGTGAVADGLKKTYPLRVIHRTGKMGLGSAVRAGFAVSTRPYMGVMDADMSHDPAILNELVYSLTDNDIAMGSRFSIGSIVDDWTWWRRGISEVGVALTRLLTGVKDPLSGYFFLRRAVVEHIPLEANGYKILLEILVKGHYERVKEIPFRFRMRKYSTSKLTMREHCLFIGQILLYTWYKIRHCSL